MPSWRCVVQGCNNKADPNQGISLHNSPSNKADHAKWKRFVCMHRKGFSPSGRFVICSDHFSEACFVRSLHVKGSTRRLQSGSLPSVWQNGNATTEVPTSARSRRQVSRVYYFPDFMSVLPM